MFIFMLERNIMAKQLLREGLWTAIAKVLFKNDIKKLTKAVQNDPKVKAAAKDVEVAVTNLEKALDYWDEKYGQ